MPEKLDPNLDPDLDPTNIQFAKTTSVKPPKNAEGEIAEEDGKDRAAAQVAAVMEIFPALLRGAKTISVYRHNTSQYSEYLGQTFQLISDYLSQHEQLRLQVEQTGFKLNGVYVYQEDASEQNLATRFYRDGVRILVFREGLALEELKNLILITLANFRAVENMFEDTVSLMWKNEFEHIEYIVVETIATGGEAEDNARDEVDKIVNHLYGRLTSTSTDSISFARISIEDLDIEIGDVEQAKGVSIRGTTATPEQQALVQREIQEEEENRMLPKLAVILFKVLQDELDNDLGQAVEDVFLQLLDSFLIRADFRGINRTLHKLDSLLALNLPPGNLSRIRQIAERFAIWMAEPERLEQVAQILNRMPEIREPEEVFRYLTRLDETASVPMLTIVEQMERFDARRLFCDALVKIGKEHVDLFVRRLESPKANLVRDMLYIIDKLNPPNKYSLLSKLLGHANLAIRLESLHTLGTSGQAHCRAYVLQALEDPNLQMRLAAVKLLPNFDLEQASGTLLRIAQAADFQQREDQEKSAISTALAMTNTEEALDFLKTELRASNLVGKRKHFEHKLCVLSGLVQSGSIGVFKMLKAELETGHLDEELKRAVHAACLKLREKLLGTSKAESGT